MSSILNLPCVRYVKRVSNGALLSKYSYLAMMQQNAEALKTAPWRLAATQIREVSMPVNKVTETDAEYDESGVMTNPPSFTAFSSDAFDAYQQGGDARKETGTMCGYAGCVAYRFKLPDSASSVPLEEVKLLISRDRYCRAGVRVALVLSNDETPSADWAVVRGEGSGAIVSPSTASDAPGVDSWGFLGQQGVGNLLSGRAAEDSITFKSSDFAALAATGRAYLWAYLTLEDYAAYWTMYNGTDPRYYSIEGSAMIVASKAAFTFAGAVVHDAEVYEDAWPVNDAGYETLIHNQLADNKIGATLRQVAAYGNLLHCTRTSAIFIADGRGGFLNNLDAMPAKDMFDVETWPWGISAASNSHFPPVPLSEFATLASVRMPFVDVTDGGSVIGKDRAYSPNLHYFGFRLLRKSEDVGMDGPPEGAELDPATCRLYPVTCAMWTYCAYYVPNGRSSYKRMMLTHNNSTISAGLVCDLLVWRSSSRDFSAGLAHAALAALAKCPAFFTGSAGRIEGSFAGDGELSHTVSASATLLQRIPCASMVHASPYQTDVELKDSVKPGEILIIVPSVSMASVSEIATSVDLSLSVAAGLYCELA